MPDAASLNGSQIRGRLAIVDGLLNALGELHTIDAAVSASWDRDEALRRLTGSEFAYTEHQAHHILDMTTSRRTKLARTELERERDRLNEDLRRLADG